MQNAIRKLVFVVYALMTRAMTLGVRAVILDEQGAVFLVRHTYTPGWHLPGGGVERGETLVDALKKELLEEANIELTAPAVHFHTYKNQLTSRFDHVAVFLCHHWQSKGPRQPDHEIAESGFFAIDALPSDTTRSTRKRLAEVLEGEAVSDYW